MDDVIVAYRVKNEELLLERSLKSVMDLADKIVILDDHSTDRTEEIARSFDKVTWVSSPFDNTLDEVRDKNYLVEEALKLKPLWIMGVDGDEELEPGGAVPLRALINKMSNSRQCPKLVHFQFLYLWDSPETVRWDGLYAKFISPRLWKVGYEHSKYRFEYINASTGFHCGWIPPYITEPVPYRSKVNILHWGNLTKEIRRHKYVWYNLNDPNNFAEDRYRHIASAGYGYMYAGKEIKLVPLSDFLGKF